MPHTVPDNFKKKKNKKRPTLSDTLMDGKEGK